jgi:superfamily II DNA or RNA helicase
MLQLRPYQQDCLDAILSLREKGNHRQLISLPTAAGKTVIFAHLVKKFDCRVLIIAHTSEILKQAQEKLLMVNPDIDMGFVDAEHKEFNAQVVIASVQSAGIDSNLEQLINQNFPLLIYDEAHHAAAEGAKKVIDRLGFGENTNKLLVGLTATAFRQDGKGLGKIFDVIAFERTTKQMIDDGFLCPPQGYKIATDVDLSRVKTVDGDFVGASLAKVMDTPEMNAMVISAYMKRADGRKAICFGTTVQHAKNLAEGFVACGINAKVIHGEMTLKDREQVLKDYQTGSTQILCNCQLLTEGVDLPETSCIIVARPTKSKGLYQQMVGRGLRLWPNKKDCVVLDFSDRNHSICSAAVLLDDVIITDDQAKDRKQKESEDTLPAQLNPALKSAIVSHDPLGKNFTWEKDGDNYIMRGGGLTHIEIQKIKNNEQYNVVFSDENGSKPIARNLNFEWAFSTAEDFAKENRKLFAISDREAAWRKLPISPKQKELLRKYGYRAGIDLLTKGQASEIIQSGVLRKSR